MRRGSRTSREPFKEETAEQDYARPLLTITGHEATQCELDEAVVEVLAGLEALQIRLVTAVFDLCGRRIKNEGEEMTLVMRDD